MNKLSRIRDNRVCVSQIRPVTAPLILLRAGHHAGFDWIQMNIPQQAQEVAVLLHQLALKPALEHMPRPVVPLIKIMRVIHVNAVHGLADIGKQRPQKKMNMVRHQRIGVNLQPIPRHGP